MPAHVQLLTSNSISASLKLEENHPDVPKRMALKKKQPKSQGPLASTVLVRLLGIPMVPSTFHAATGIVVESKKRNAQPIHTYLRYVSMCVKWLKEKRRLTGSLNDSVRGHYIANPNKALFSGNPSKLPATFPSMFDPPQTGPIWWPLSVEIWNDDGQFATATSSNQIETAGWPVFPIRTWPVTNGNSTTKTKTTTHIVSGDMQSMWLINLIVITL